MSTLVEITALASTRPAAGAPARLVADWYQRKAVVLHHIAAESPSASERDSYETLATRATQRAVQLLTGAWDGGA
jgi:hypothetical protein